MPDAPKSTPAVSDAPEPMAEQSRVVAAAVGGLIAQLVLAGVAFVLYSTGRLRGLELLPFAALGLIPWACAVVAAVLRKARATEAFELEAARRGGESARTIFESELDARPAARRHARFITLGVPILGGILGVGLTALGLLALRRLLGFDLSNDSLPGPDLLAGATGAAAFAGFVGGYYLLGLGSQLRRPILRGAAVYLLGTVILFALVAAAAAIEAAVGIRVVTIVAYWTLPAVTLLVGIEVLLNLVLELYRPTATGETADDQRPAFNPRVVEFVVSPGGVVRQLNEAFQYQFGFEITQSWFVGVLRRSAAALILVGAGVLILLSCLVVVGPHQRGLVTTFGRLGDEPLEPGLHVKLPWPIAASTLVDVDRVRTLDVGTFNAVHELQGEDHAHQTYLWANQDDSDAGLIIVAPRRDATLSNLEAQSGQRSPAVALAAADLVVQWRLDPDRLREYVGGYENPERRLRVLAEQALSRELATYDIDEAIGARRTDAAASIEERLRRAARAEPLGIEIVQVGLKSVRPPQDVAESFNATVGAEQDRVRLTQSGQSQKEAILAGAAGSAERAQRIVEQINELDRTTGDPEARAALEAEVDAAIRRGGGTAATALLVARGDRWETENGALSRNARSLALTGPYGEAREMVARRLYLTAIRESLSGREKDVYLTPSPLHLEFEGEPPSIIAGGAGLNLDNTAAAQ